MKTSLLNCSGWVGGWGVVIPNGHASELPTQFWTKNESFTSVLAHFLLRSLRFPKQDDVLLMPSKPEKGVNGHLEWKKVLLLHRSSDARLG